MKYIAWGTSKLLWLYLNNSGKQKFSYVVESAPKANTYEGLDVYSPEVLSKEGSDAIVVLFAVSNKTISAVLKKLAEFGRGLGNGVILYSDLMKEEFKESAQVQLGWDLSDDLYDYSKTFTLNSLRPVHTTICGSWLFLEALRRTSKISGHVAEVGAYQGGNALCALMSKEWVGDKTYYIFDSLEGFPNVTDNDPVSVGRGTYNIDLYVQEVFNSFSAIPNAKFIKGFVPDTFSQLDPDSSYSIIFYDCDLYQPALDTLNYFWDRLSPGGVVLIHDYYAEPGGFHGVRKALDEFESERGVRFKSFYHNTMAVLVR